MENIFLALSVAERARLLWRLGILVADRNDGRYRITLYRLFSFYVEVLCDLDFTTIEDVRLLESPRELSRYDLNSDPCFIELE